MKQIAYLFPGQGGQFDNMGVDWCSEFTTARRTYEEASDLLELDILRLSQKGIEFHQSTRFSQVAIFVHSIAIWRVLLELGFAQSPSIFAGMSLGEFSALIASEKGEFNKLLPLIDQRGLLMENACQGLSSGMSAIIGLTAQQLAELIDKEGEDRSAWLANFNSPLQIVIAGENRALSKLELAVAKAEGRFKRLSVAGAFHTPLMKGAGKKWSLIWRNFDLIKSSSDFYSSVSGQLENNPYQIAELIDQQIWRPVQWLPLIQRIREKQPRNWIEVGGDVLRGIQRRIDASTQVTAVKSVVDLKKVSSLR